MPFFSTSHQRTLVARYMLTLVARSHTADVGCQVSVSTADISCQAIVPDMTDCIGGGPCMMERAKAKAKAKVGLVKEQD